MTRRIRTCAARLGLDLVGLDKRQQRRAVRRAAAAGTRDGFDPRVAHEIRLYQRVVEAVIHPHCGNSLRLGSECLFSKWGFNDGDDPEPWLDYCDEYEITYPRRDEWNRVLRRLVRERLLPKLPAYVEVYDVDSLHNPIRADRVDGHYVRWNAGDAASAHYWPEVEVWIPWGTVAQKLEKIRARTPISRAAPR